jgi:MOSC domain-containing protein YiiM
MSIRAVKKPWIERVARRRSTKYPAEMKVISVNVGRPREIQVDDEVVRTSIFKSPVAGTVHVGRVNLEGDEQSDLTVHGGVRKAVYVYPSEHYAFWRAELPGVDLPWGAFGENLTTEGLLEEAVAPGDRLRIGAAEFVVTQPRTPCYKLAIRLQRADIIKRFLNSGRSGFYLSVAKEGSLAAGNPIAILSHDQAAITVAQIASRRRAG